MRTRAVYGDKTAARTADLFKAAAALLSALTNPADVQKLKTKPQPESFFKSITSFNDVSRHNMAARISKAAAAALGTYTNPPDVEKSKIKPKPGPVFNPDTVPNPAVFNPDTVPNPAVFNPDTVPNPAVFNPDTVPNPGVLYINASEIGDPELYRAIFADLRGQPASSFTPVYKRKPKHETRAVSGDKTASGIADIPKIVADVQKPKPGAVQKPGSKPGAWHDLAALAGWKKPASVNKPKLKYKYP